MAKSKQKSISISHEDIQTAMEQFFEHGGKITKIENPSQELLLKHDLSEEEQDYIDPHAANPSIYGLGDAAELLQQEIQTEYGES